MKLTIRLLLIVVTVILIAGCDRFEHVFAPRTYPLVEHFYANFSDSLLMVSDTSSVAISSFYADNYLNNGVNKAQMEQYFRNLFISYPNSVIVPDSTYQFDPASLSFKWKLKITNMAGDTTYVDTLFSDYLTPQRDGYKFIGNQYNPVTSLKQKVLAQMVTGTWCSNCTVIEAALHQCELNYPGQFYYIEHHLNDTLAVVPHINNFMAYYGGIYSAPSTIFQGISKYSLTNTGSLSQFSALILGLINQDAKFDLSNFNYSIVGDSLIGTVNITPDGSVSQNNLVLNYAIAEEETVALNYAGLPCHNVVRAVSEKDISSAVLPGVVSFSLHLPHYKAPDSKIVIWVQTMNHPWSPSDHTSLIYNVFEQSISLAK